MSKGFRQLIEEGNTQEYAPLTLDNIKEYLIDIHKLRAGVKKPLFRRMCDKIFTKQPLWSWYGKSAGPRSS